MIQQEGDVNQVGLRCLVAGRVQGVFFRASAREQALRLGLTGYARNLPDGRVEVLACGPVEAVARLRDWLRNGPPLAEVTAGPLACPKCGIGHIIEGRRGFGCNRYREGCDFVVWKEVAGRLLDENQIRCLIATGCTGLIQGFNVGGGTRFDDSLRLDDHWRVVLDFPVDEGDSNPGKLE